MSHRGEPRVPEPRGKKDHDDGKGIKVWYAFLWILIIAGLAAIGLVLYYGYRK